MDDLLDLFEADDGICNNHDTSKHREDISDNSLRSRSSSTINYKPSGNNRLSRDNDDSSERQINKTVVSVDERIGIRMINRHICGTDLLNMLCENSYISPAQLSSMSLNNLNTRVLVEPAAIVDVANVFGRTNMMTVGIVFSNSGSRLSSSGSAFCIVQIGSSMQSGPTVSMMLFGHSYSTHCRSLVPGKVIAVFNPRLLPLNSNNRKKSDGKGKVDYTSISFTVSDSEQVKFVADAQDYGVCKGTMSGKNENGHWVSNARKCTQYIDKRQGDYCQLHRQQQHRQQSNLATKTNGLDRLKEESKAFPTVRRLITLHTNNETMMQRHQPTSNPMRSPAPSSHTTNLKSSNPLLNPRQNYCMNIASNDVRMSTNSANIQNKTSQVTPLSLNTSAASKRVAAVSPPTPSFLDLRTKQLQPLTSRTIQQAQSQKNESILSNLRGKNERKRPNINVNTDIVGFNGSVPVPRESKLFRGVSQAASLNRSSQTNHLQRLEEIKTKKVLENIAKQAERCQQSNQKENHHKRMRPKTANIVPASTITAREDLLFGSLNNIDHEKIISATSRFNNEVEAEEYARKRRIVADLEVEEAKKDASTNQKMKKKDNGQIQKEYHCKTCKRTFKMKPVGCIKLQHEVSVERLIQETKSIAEHRQSLTEKHVVDGGLVLGAGIEWSKWNRFS